MTVLSVDEATVRIWAELRASSEASGFTKQVADFMDRRNGQTTWPPAFDK
jgi:hypothetical protein